MPIQKWGPWPPFLFRDGASPGSTNHRSRPAPRAQCRGCDGGLSQSAPGDVAGLTRRPARREPTPAQDRRPSAPAGAPGCSIGSNRIGSCAWYDRGSPAPREPAQFSQRRCARCCGGRHRQRPDRRRWQALVDAAALPQRSTGSRCRFRYRPAGEFDATGTGFREPPGTRGSMDARRSRMRLPHRRRSRCIPRVRRRGNASRK